MLGLLLLTTAVSSCRTTNAVNEVDFIGGHPATEGMFPSLVAIRFGALCGATKVASRTFLTAAHCLMSPQGLARIKAGKKLSVGVGIIPQYRDVMIASTSVHPDFKAGAESGQNQAQLSKVAPDLAVIKFEVDLPEVAIAPVDPEPIATGEILTLMGWGCQSDFLSAQQNIQPEGSVPGDQLRYAELSVNNVSDYFATFHKATEDDVHARLCQGDSGTSVQYEGRVVGINSFRNLGAQIWSAVARVDRRDGFGNVGDWLAQNGIPYADGASPDQPGPPTPIDTDNGSEPSPPPQDLPAPQTPKAHLTMILNLVNDQVSNCEIQIRTVSTAASPDGAYSFRLQARHLETGTTYLQPSSKVYTTNLSKAPEDAANNLASRIPSPHFPECAN